MAFPRGRVLQFLHELTWSFHIESIASMQEKPVHGSALMAIDSDHCHAATARLQVWQGASMCVLPPAAIYLRDRKRSIAPHDNASVLPWCGQQMAVAMTGSEPLVLGCHVYAHKSSLACGRWRRSLRVRCCGCFQAPALFALNFRFLKSKNFAY